MTNLMSRLKAALKGRYAIERELGEGGMATVYLAEDLKRASILPQQTALAGRGSTAEARQTTQTSTSPAVTPTRCRCDGRCPCRHGEPIERVGAGYLLFSALFRLPRAAEVSPRLATAGLSLPSRST